MFTPCSTFFLFWEQTLFYLHALIHRFLYDVKYPSTIIFQTYESKIYIILNVHFHFSSSKILLLLSLFSLPFVFTSSSNSADSRSINPTHNAWRAFEKRKHNWGLKQNNSELWKWRMMERNQALSSAWLRTELKRYIALSLILQNCHQVLSSIICNFFSLS